MTPDPRDISIMLIIQKAGYGLARPAWLRTLEAIRELPALDREGP